MVTLQRIFRQVLWYVRMWSALIAPERLRIVQRKRRKHDFNSSRLYADPAMLEQASAGAYGKHKSMKTHIDYSGPAYGATLLPGSVYSVDQPVLRSGRWQHYTPYYY